MDHEDRSEKLKLNDYREGERNPLVSTSIPSLPPHQNSETKDERIYRIKGIHTERRGIREFDKNTGEAFFVRGEFY